MMTTAGYSGIMAATKSWENTQHLDPETRFRVVGEEAVLGAVSGPAKVAKEILKSITPKK